MGCDSTNFIIYILSAINLRSITRYTVVINHCGAVANGRDQVLRSTVDREWKFIMVLSISSSSSRSYKFFTSQVSYAVLFIKSGFSYSFQCEPIPKGQLLPLKRYLKKISKKSYGCKELTNLIIHKEFFELSNTLREIYSFQYNVSFEYRYFIAPMHYIIANCACNGSALHMKLTGRPRSAYNSRNKGKGRETNNVYVSNDHNEMKWKTKEDVCLVVRI